MNLNQVVLIGRLTKDVEIKMTQSGKKYAQCTLAVNRNKDTADFIPVVFWENTAELLKSYCHKGGKINVVGRIQTRTYDDPNIPNRKVYITEVVANQIEFLDSKPTATTNEPTADVATNNYSYINGEDLPF